MLALLVFLGLAAIGIILAVLFATGIYVVDLGFLNREFPAGVKLSTYISVLLIAIVSVVAERIITRYVRRFARRARLAPHVGNSLVLTFRLIILIGAAVALIRAGGLPTEWLVALSALGGAAVGLASTKTIGNFIAGLYLLASRPFKVGDLVRIGTVEGIVEEMSINYTKILTMGKNVVSISNLQIMDRDITNFAFENEKGQTMYCYTYEITFDHSAPSEAIAESFREAFERYRGKLPEDPRYTLTRSGAFERVYLVYLYVENPEDIFSLRSEIYEDVFRRWDRIRKTP